MRVVARHIWLGFCMVIIQAFLLLQFTSVAHIHTDDHEHEQTSCVYCLVAIDEDDDENVEIDLDDSGPNFVKNWTVTRSFSQISLYYRAPRIHAPKRFTRSVRAPPLT